MAEMGISVGLFAFTSIRGTSLEDLPQPDLSYYRRIQIIRALIASGELEQNQVTYDEKGHLSISIDSKRLKDLISTSVVFQVSGCIGCNRPFYNERPRGPMYNYPRPLNEDEIAKAMKESGLVV